MELKRLPIGIQSFRKLREGDYLYVDKTMYIHKLITENDYIFLSRPRRFGKSLLISTIEEIFKGNRELFKGLWIYDSDYDWVEYPVIKLDMSEISVENFDYLKEDLYLMIRDVIWGYEVDLDTRRYNQAFRRAIRLLYRKYNRKVVILIDEYDAPIINALEDV